LKNPKPEPGLGDIISGNGGKAADAPRLVDAHGASLSGKEKQELRQQQKRMKEAQFKFHIQTFSQYCDDDGQIRMMWRIINDNPATGIKTVLMEFGYSAGQLESFIQAIESHEKEIEEAKLKLDGDTDEGVPT